MKSRLTIDFVALYIGAFINAIVNIFKIVFIGTTASIDELFASLGCLIVIIPREECFAQAGLFWL